MSEYTGCDNYEAPAVGDKCKNCQKGKAKHKPEEVPVVVEAPKVVEVISLVSPRDCQLLFHLPRS